MKKLFLIALLIAGVFFVSQPVVAKDGLSVYSVSCSTISPLSYSASDSKMPDITGYARIHKILITNTDVTVDQTITFYELCTTTTTATAMWSVDIDSTSATGQIEPIEIDWPIEAEHWLAKDLAIRKSSASSTVKVTVFYH